jgi:hypothetical protein
MKHKTAFRYKSTRVPLDSFALGASAATAVVAFFVTGVVPHLAAIGLLCVAIALHKYY